MNLKMLTWIIALLILLLCAANGVLLFVGIEAGNSVKKTTDLSLKEFNRLISVEREKIKEKMDEKYGEGMELFPALAKKVEAEKNRVKELEGILNKGSKK